MKLRKFSLIKVIFFILTICPALYGEPLNKLFIDVPPAAVSSVKQKHENDTPAVIRNRYVQVRFDFLLGNTARPGANSIVLNLFNDVSFMAIKDHIEMRSAERYTWFGRIEGEGYSHAILTVENGGMAGSIMVDKKDYRIKDVGGGIHAIYEINQNALEPFRCGTLDMPPKAIPNTSDFIPLIKGTDNYPIIDIMVVYTQDVASASENIKVEIQTEIDKTNQAFANSHINQRLRLVHSAQVTYTETGDSAEDKHRLVDPDDGYLDNVHTLRDTYGADLVSFWLKDLNVGDSANILFSHCFDPPESCCEEVPFSILKYGHHTHGLPFSHELGHNMGVVHDRYKSYLPGAYDYSHGYTSLAGKFWTVMAYYNECSEHYGIN